MRTLLACTLLLSLAAADRDADQARKTKAAELAKAMASKDVETRLGAAREAARIQHASLNAPLAKLLKDKDERVRTEAITALSMREDPKDKRAGAKALVARIKPLEKGGEATREELLAIVSALHDLAQPSTIKPLLDMKSDCDTAVANARLMAVGNIPSKEAIDRLIQFSDKGRRGRRQLRSGAHKALIYATGERVSGGVDGWRRWWSENKATFNLDAAADRRVKERVENAEKNAKRKNRKGKGKKKKDDA